MHSVGVTALLSLLRTCWHSFDYVIYLEDSSKWVVFTADSFVARQIDVFVTNSKWSKNFSERLHRMSCRHWGRMVHFAEYTTAETRCFSMGWKTLKISPSHGGSRSPSNSWPTWVSPQMPFLSVQRFLWGLWILVIILMSRI